MGEVRLALTVKDSAGSTLLDTTRGNADKGAKFSFAAPNSYRAGDVEDAYEYDDFEPSGTLSACLILTFDDAVHRPGVKRAVLFSIQPQSKLGVDTEGPPAKEGGVMAVARQMEQMEGTLNDMVGDLVALQQRERRLVKKTEATGGRLLVLSVVSYIILVAVATTQIQHYRSFFKAKKLL